MRYLRSHGKYQTLSTSKAGMADLHELSGLRGSEWVGVGCVGRSGLSGLSGSKAKPHFHASLIFFKKRQPRVFFIVLNFCSNHSIHATHSSHSTHSLQ